MGDLACASGVPGRDLPVPARGAGTGRGYVYLDVWNGFDDAASREVALGSDPQNVSLLVELPREAPSEALGPQLQVRTYDFPLDVTLTPEVYRVGPAL